MSLLHIVASPNGAASTSTRVASAFLDAYASAHPGASVDTLDLWATELPDFDATAVGAQNKILAGAEQTPDERAVWSRITTLCDQLRAADAVLVSCPMWNFTVPYKLKQYLDLVCQPGVTFAWTPQDGYTGLVTGAPVQLILTRAGAYLPPSEKGWMDYQTNYLEFIFGFLGFTDIRTLAVEPTMLQGPDAANQAIAAAVDAARTAGTEL